MGMEEPQAVVRIVDGKIVLDDPAAEGMIAAVRHHNRGIAKQNCKLTFDLNVDRVEHFKNRIAERGFTPDDVVIVLISVDDPHGGPLADMLMPNHDWQQYRDKGEKPIARGLATREGIQEDLETFDKQAAHALKYWKGIAVVVVDYGVAEVFSAD